MHHRPLFTQFCGNDSSLVVAAARHIESHTNYVDLNFGCPQRIAKKGKYGAFLMDDLVAVEKLVCLVSMMCIEIRPLSVPSILQMWLLGYAHAYFIQCRV